MKNASNFTSNMGKSLNEKLIGARPNRRGRKSLKPDLTFLGDGLVDESEFARPLMGFGLANDFNMVKSKDRLDVIGKKESLIASTLLEDKKASISSDLGYNSFNKRRSDIKAYNNF